MQLFKKIHPLLFWFIVIVLITIIGVCGFMIIEDFAFIDALYMTVITITTIGYGEINKLSEAGRIFNISFIVTSFALFTYALATLTQYVASGELKNFLKNRKLMKDLKNLENHVIICGFGRNGQQAARTLHAHKHEFVIIDNRDEMIDNWIAHENDNLLYIKGDATDDNVLLKAGIHKAQSLICALPNDANNVFIVLSAKALNPSLKIICRANALSSVAKLKNAGATSISMPDVLGGVHMATQVSKPDVIEFIEYLTGEEGDSINIESVDYNKLPPEIRNTSLRNIMDWKKTGVTCIGIKDEQGKFLINPDYNIVIKENMKVIVLGNNEQINDMKHNVDE